MGGVASSTSQSRFQSGRTDAVHGLLPGVPLCIAGGTPRASMEHEKQSGKECTLREGEVQGGAPCVHKADPLGEEEVS